LHSAGPPAQHSAMHFPFNANMLVASVTAGAQPDGGRHRQCCAAPGCGCSAARTPRRKRDQRRPRGPGVDAEQRLLAAEEQGHQASARERAACATAWRIPERSRAKGALQRRPRRFGWGWIFHRSIQRHWGDAFCRTRPRRRGRVEKGYGGWAWVGDADRLGRGHSERAAWVQQVTRQRRAGSRPPSTRGQELIAEGRRRRHRQAQPPHP